MTTSTLFLLLLQFCFNQNKFGFRRLNGFRQPPWAAEMLLCEREWLAESGRFTPRTGSRSWGRGSRGRACVFYAGLGSYSPNISHSCRVAGQGGPWTTVTLQTHALMARCPETASPATVDRSASPRSWGFRDCTPGIPKAGFVRFANEKDDDGGRPCGQPYGD